MLHYQRNFYRTNLLIAVHATHDYTIRGQRWKLVLILSNRPFSYLHLIVNTLISEVVASCLAVATCDATILRKKILSPIVKKRERERFKIKNSKKKFHRNFSPCFQLCLLRV